MSFQFIQKSGLKGFTEISIVEMFDNSPEAVIRKAAFRKETMDMRVPFQRSAEGMKDAGETGNEVSVFIQFMEKPEDDAAYSLKKAVQQGPVIQKERPQVFINGKNEVSVCAVNEFKGHFCGEVNGVFVTAGRAKLRMAAEGNEFQFAAVGTGKHGTTKRRVSTVNHLLHVFQNNGTRMKSIFNFFVVFFKNFL